MSPRLTCFSSVRLESLTRLQNPKYAARAAVSPAFRAPFKDYVHVAAFNKNLWRTTSSSFTDGSFATCGQKHQGGGGALLHHPRWPGSVRLADRPSELNVASRPFVNLTAFEVLNVNSVSCDELVDFIQSNGVPSFRWPRLSREQRKKKQEKSLESLKKKSERANHQLKPDTKPPVSAPLPRPTAASAPRDTMSVPPLAKAWPSYPVISAATSSKQEDEAEQVRGRSLEAYLALTRTVQAPIMSFACRPGWKPNDKETRIPSAEYNYAPFRKTNENFAAKPLNQAQPAGWGEVSFTRAPEKDVETFLAKFLGTKEEPAADPKNTDD
ncbi:hypothetical protein F4777DRAFT_582488 [Nemania sp. FL0916]|nr:hypothetical protein F4777DRAFT_582488 [Nemania sp. FL0916]